MVKSKLRVLAILTAASFFVPLLASAGPTYNFLYPFAGESTSAKAYLVMDRESGDILIQKNAELPWTPASLTKLVTAMVVLDQNPNFDSQVAMAKSDEVGGARLYTKPGIKYKLGDLLYASLVASANNATNALARGSGLAKADFIAKMNEKARGLGALNTNFIEPTGIDPKNTTTVQDYAKIVKAAFSYPKILDAVRKKTYNFKATNSSKYKHNLTNTDKLLDDLSLGMVGGKTGYLDESMYNFAAEFKDVDGKNIIVVLFGSKNHETQFLETKQLAIWAWVNFKWAPAPIVPRVAGAFIEGLKMPDGYPASN